LRYVEMWNKSRAMWAEWKMKLQKLYVNVCTQMPVELTTHNEGVCLPLRLLPIVAPILARQHRQ
jgi:hypothetical protein